MSHVTLRQNTTTLQRTAQPQKTRKRTTRTHDVGIHNGLLQIWHEKPSCIGPSAAGARCSVSGLLGDDWRRRDEAADVPVFVETYSPFFSVK
jgi:hypothetical protein